MRPLTRQRKKEIREASFLLVLLIAIITFMLVMSSPISDSKHETGEVMYINDYGISAERTWVIDINGTVYFAKEIKIHNDDLNVSVGDTVDVSYDVVDNARWINDIEVL